jgi:hypothetical protein
MSESNPEQQLAAKVAEALEKAGLLGSMTKAELEKQFASGKMDPYAWKRIYEKASDQSQAKKQGRAK